jgi:hypothetical protein
MPWFNPFYKRCLRTETYQNGHMTEHEVDCNKVPPRIVWTSGTYGDGYVQESGVPSGFLLAVGLAAAAAGVIRWKWSSSR